MCHFWYLGARSAADEFVNRVGAGGTHLVAPRKQAKLKRNLPRDRRQISPDPSVAQSSSISDEAAPLNRYRSGPQSPLFQWRLNVRLIGLLLAGMLVSTGAVVAQAIPLGSDI
jgi:hypothetical protein